MFNAKVRNRDEVVKALNRIEKRKGKAVSSRTLQDGDLFRFGSSSEVLIFRVEGNDASAYPAWSDLLGSMCFGVSGPHNEVTDFSVQLLAHKSDYPQPDKESPIKTFVRPRSDGTFCCQNMIYHMSGQHFRVTPERLAELKAEGGREWIEETTPCTCDLPVGFVREYDGRVWENKSSQTCDTCAYTECEYKSDPSDVVKNSCKSWVERE